MWRKVLFILLLAGAFATFLFVQPWKKDEPIRPRIIDRLPKATIIGQSNLLQLSKDLSKTFYYHQIPYRDVLSPNIILSRGKKYGIDTQKPVYFFINDSLSGNDWGILFTISDESKIAFGLQRISKSFKVRDTILNKKEIHYLPEFNLFIAYQKDWLMIYQGKHCTEILKNIQTAKLKTVHPRWREFLNRESIKKNHLVAEIKSQHLKKYGVKSMCIRLENDSTHFTINSVLQHFDTLAFQLVNGGYGFVKHEFTKQLINLNLNVDYLKQHPEHPYHKFLHQYASKIGFPMDDFWESFGGNIAFRRGGIEYIKENYIVSEMDENFNITEVTKSRKVKISNFSLFLTTNSPSEKLFNKIKTKGIISEDGKKHRFIFSPPFNKHLRDSSMIFYTGQYEPVVNPLINNQILWTFDYTPVQFYIDSTTTKTLYGRIKFPVKKLINDYLK